MGAQMTDKEWMGRLLHAYMQKNGLRSKDMAKRFHVSTSTACDFVNGKRLPGFEMLTTIHEVTNIPYDAFFREGKWSVWR